MEELSSKARNRPCASVRITCDKEKNAQQKPYLSIALQSGDLTKSYNQGNFSNKIEILQ
ncbi:conserved hypothetical protein [Ricinus communis]|uniref:Uncharacterized protein n=1 Tax=Ricinus communis TaxID=3988 RepID=B9SLS2_RICCO|nr:conserved hypothetical protein [Ricinus communis]